MRRRSPLALLAAVVLLGFTVTACTSSGSGTGLGNPGTGKRGSAPQTGTAGTGIPGTGGFTIDWHDCNSYQCGTLKVPVDYADPKGKQLELGLVKLPARKKSGNRGPLLVNPGGPGASGIELAESLPWPDTIRDHFDIIGFDPRGVGESTKVTCGVPAEQLYHVDYVPDTPAETNALLDVSKRYVDNCENKYAGLLPHLGTPDVARDMDSIRKGLGAAKLNYLGFSYGTSIGQVYTDLFPTHIRAMVLDGVVNLDQSGIQSAQGQGIAFEHLLDQFESWCKARSSCDANPDPKALVQRVYDKTQRGTIPAPDADRPFGPGEFQLGVIDPLYSGQAGYARLATALSEADKGDGSKMVDLADEYLSSGSTEIYFAVSCTDQAWPRNPQTIIDAGKAIQNQAPLLGEATVTDYVRCGIWPVPSTPVRTPTTPKAPPIIVISTTDDPATPYENGVKLAKALPGAMLLTNEGSAHTIYGQGESCVDDKVDAYLVDLTKLPPNARCSG